MKCENFEFFKTSHFNQSREDEENSHSLNFNQTFHDFIQGYSAIHRIEIQIISMRLTLQCWENPEYFPSFCAPSLSSYRALTVLHNLHKISVENSATWNFSNKKVSCHLNLKRSYRNFFHH